MGVEDAGTIPRDTASEALAVYYTALRSMRPEDRVRQTLAWSRRMRSILADGIRFRHPEYDEPTVWREVLRRTLGDVALRCAPDRHREAAMIDPESSLSWLVKELERAGVPYMVSGSLASTYYGEYRATADVDLVIAPTVSQIDVLLESLGDEFYASRDAAHEAIRARTMFNVIHPASGFKADLIIRKQRQYSIEEFKRRVQVPMLGRLFFVASAEDVILSKLEWSKLGESERQFRDALGVAVVQWPDLDFPYLERWSRELGVYDLLNRLIEQAKKQIPPQ